MQASVQASGVSAGVSAVFVIAGVSAVFVSAGVSAVFVSAGVSAVFVSAGVRRGSSDSVCFRLKEGAHISLCRRGPVSTSYLVVQMVYACCYSNTIDSG